VFSSLLDDAFQDRLAQTMWRWVRPGGGVLWYDFTFDNPRNPDVRGIPVRRIRQLFSEGSLRVRRITLAPPLARSVCRIHSALYVIERLRVAALTRPRLDFHANTEQTAAPVSATGDRNLGHYCRYSKGSWKHVARAKGCREVVTMDANVAALFRWWMNARVPKKTEQSEHQIAICDSLVVPISSRVERWFESSFGQAIVAVLGRQ
jgi:hypothetical protein